MISTVIDVDDDVALRAAGIRALNKDLGATGAKKFMDLCFGGEGDYTAEKQLYPTMSDAKYNALLAKIEAAAV